MKAALFAAAFIGAFVFTAYSNSYYVFVMATLALYLNIYNLFVNLLQILMALLGERD